MKFAARLLTVAILATPLLSTPASAQVPEWPKCEAAKTALLPCVQNNLVKVGKNTTIENLMKMFNMPYNPAGTPIYDFTKFPGFLDRYTQTCLGLGRVKLVNGKWVYTGATHFEPEGSPVKGALLRQLRNCMKKQETTAKKALLDVCKRASENLRSSCVIIN